MANGIYTFGMCFILAHEYAHFDLKHPESTPDNEYAADNSAFLYMKGYEDDNINYQYVLIGSISALYVLMFLDNTMIESESHPDNNDRIVKIIETFDLDENHDVWQIPLFFLKMWCSYNQIEMTMFEQNLEKGLSKKEFYIKLCSKIKYR